MPAVYPTPWERIWSSLVAFAEGAVDECVLRNFSNVVPTLKLPAAAETVHQLDSLSQARTRAHTHTRVHAYSYVYMCIGGALGRGGEGAHASARSRAYLRNDTRPVEKADRFKATGEACRIPSASVTDSDTPCPGKAGESCTVEFDPTCMYTTYRVYRSTQTW